MACFFLVTSVTLLQSTASSDKFRSFLVDVEDLNKALNEANELNANLKEELKEANETRRKQQEQMNEMNGTISTLQQKIKGMNTSTDGTIYEQFMTIRHSWYNIYT